MKTYRDGGKRKLRNGIMPYMESASYGKFVVLFERKKRSKKKKARLSGQPWSRSGTKETFVVDHAPKANFAFRSMASLGNPMRDNTTTAGADALRKFTLLNGIRQR